MSQKNYTENLLHFNTSFDETEKIRFLHAYGIVVAIVDEEVTTDSLARAKTVLKRHSKLDIDFLAVSFNQNIESELIKKLEVEHIKVALGRENLVGVHSTAKNKAEQFILDFLEEADQAKNTSYKEILLKNNLDKSGIIYLLRNPSFEDLVLIGKTNQDLKSSIKSLDNFSLPYPFELAYACKVADMFLVEQTLYHAFDGLRIRKDRNFFKVSISKPQRILELVCLEIILI